jgi:hypothetical protein
VADWNRCHQSLEWHENPMVIPLEREDELKSVLQTQPATGLRSKPIARSNDFLWI